MTRSVHCGVVPEDAPDTDTAAGKGRIVAPAPPAPGETAPPPPSSGDLVQAARRAGGYAWLEMRLFELLGRWATSVAEPPVAARLGTASRHHGWHAELWHEHLPSVPDLDVADLVAPADRGIAATVDDLVIAVPDSAVEALASAYRVLVPRLVVAYDHDLAGASRVADAPVARTIRIVLADLVPEWIAGERLLAGLLTDRDAVERAAARTARLELLLAGAPAPGRDPGSG